MLRRGGSALCLWHKGRAESENDLMPTVSAPLRTPLMAALTIFFACSSVVSSTPCCNTSTDWANGDTRRCDSRELAGARGAAGSQGEPELPERAVRCAMSGRVVNTHGGSTTFSRSAHEFPMLIAVAETECALAEY